VPERPPGRSGCSKPLLIGCGAVLLLLGIGLVLMLTNLPKLVQWSFSMIEQDIMSRLAPDVTPEDRAHLAAAFEDARRAMASMDQEELAKFQALQKKIMEIAPAARKLSRNDVQELTRLLEDLAGKKAPAEATPPAP